jgi:hypothetical protein
MFNVFTTGGSVVSNLTTSPSNLKSYAIFNSTNTLYSVKIYNSTGPTAGSTTNMVLALGIPGNGGANLSWEAGPFSSNGWSIIPTALLDATSTGVAPSNQAINFTYQV